MVKLGDEVKDPITGIKGIAMCRHSYLQGCDRITIQRKVRTDGSMPDELSFDEPQLIVVKKAVVKGNGDTTRGGPERHMPSKRTAVTR